ncbi:hypothetical protein CNYM01_14085 [Colletotrichum nymphaeae SA-01]|uniref:Uncharacterized protein n=1 Tax=Colletotrichum nymphaeae SA-01 TaxID=1460502 RepID=A0A135US36_9PEZI|nr:hypothetical protein CNYM01_14085 [Colletotrichum nymphaeae SA-01]
MWYPYTKGMTPFERCKARWAMYARLGQGHAPGAVRGPPYNGRGTRSASRGGTAAVSGPHSISEGQVQLPQGGGHGQVGFYLGKAGGPPNRKSAAAAAAAAAAALRSTYSSLPTNTTIPCVCHGQAKYVQSSAQGLDIFALPGCHVHMSEFQRITYYSAFNHTCSLSSDGHGLPLPRRLFKLRPPSITFRYLILETSPPPAPPTVNPESTDEVSSNSRSRSKELHSDIPTSAWPGPRALKKTKACCSSAHPFPLLPQRASARAAAWAVEYHGHTRRLATRPMTPPPPPPGITSLKGPAVENPRCFELRPGLSTPLSDILALRFETESK